MPISNRVTIREIASRLGVSHVTVSLALKESPRISKGRRAEVQAMARKMGYRPDPTLSSLMAYRQGKRLPKIQSALAWINHWENPDGWRKIKEFNGYWKGASRAAEARGYRLDEFVWEPEFTAERFETILQTRDVRGLLIPPHPSQPDWGNFHWDKFSIIRFGLSVRAPCSHVVTADHFQSTLSAVEKIHSHGYKRIGFVMPRDFDIRLGGGYTGGFVTAQQLLKLRHPLPPLVIDQHESMAGFSEMLKRWLDKHAPDAILTVDTRLPLALKQLGVRVPEDVTVAAASIQDIPVDAGINQNSEEIGRVAAETLITLINSNDIGVPVIPRRILIEGFWVNGNSLPNRKALANGAMN